MRRRERTDIETGHVTLAFLAYLVMLEPMNAITGTKRRRLLQVISCMGDILLDRSLIRQVRGPNI